MRDLPLAGDEFAGSQRQRGLPPEVSHERPGPYGDAAGTTRGPGDRARGRVPAQRAAGGAPSRRPPGRGRRHARRDGRGRIPRWLLPVVAVALVASAGLGVALVKVTGGGTADVTLSGDGTSASPSVSVAARASASASASATTNMGVESGTGESGPATLAGVLAAANSSVEGHGLLPPGRCGQYQQDAGGAIVCTAPVAGVAEVYYENYSSLPALYDAYKTQVAELDGGAFRQNTGTCGNGAISFAEFGWNQEEGHPHDFTVARMASGQVGQMFAAGRMACFETRTPHGVSQDIVWTIDNGPAMGVAIGNGPPMAVYQLWASLHHAVLFRGTEMCGTAGRMNMHDIPTGNLKVVPVCPAGVEAVPASP
jgi:hypothetical protein